MLLTAVEGGSGAWSGAVVGDLVACRPSADARRRPAWAKLPPDV